MLKTIPLYIHAILVSSSYLNLSKIHFLIKKDRKNFSIVFFLAILVSSSYLNLSKNSFINFLIKR